MPWEGGGDAIVAVGVGRSRSSRGDGFSGSRAALAVGGAVRWPPIIREARGCRHRSHSADAAAARFFSAAAYQGN